MYLHLESYSKWWTESEQLYLLVWQKHADSLGDNTPYFSFYRAQRELGARAHGNVFLLYRALVIGHLILLISCQKYLSFKVVALSSLLL